MEASNYSHPYVPRELVGLVLPDFTPGFLSQSTILGVFGIASFLVITSSWIVSGNIIIIIMIWSDFIGKGYRKGDSRYAGRDSGVVSVEGITAVIEGPTCLLTV
ncbi:hypothetical protein IFM89_038827 [Coptis chinensis]|uniref:Uncharacterized protein n=1 Tax=Coptis chinensis TaxID=261450 RepID=A0A835HT25_9MAGN|nr:hypothetical protein IFM89_038827 [Coptis chinensis]